MATQEDFQTASQDRLRAMIQRRHPSYDCNVDHWHFLESTYLGGRAWFLEHIFRYHKEGLREFKDRINRAYRFNHTREIVDLINKYVFKGEITRNLKNAPDEVKKFWQASTFAKRPISDFMEAMSRRASTFGRVWVVLDSNAPDETLSEAESKQLNLRVYGYTVKPDNVLDFAYDDDGELEWIMIRETKRDDADPLSSSGAVDVMYRIWTKTYWVLFKEDVSATDRTKKIVLVDFREHNLGIVPAFPHDHIYTDDREAAPALINDAAYLDRAVANYLSNLDAIIQDQTFSQLAIPAQSMMPGDDDYKNLVQMGTKRIFAYNADGGGKPEFISPDPKQAQLILAVVTKIVDEIYHSVGMAGERTKQDNATGIDNSSGVAKAYDFERLNALLVAKARSLEIAERNIVRIVLAYHGKLQELEETPDLVAYPTTFDVRSLTDEFDVAQKLMLIDAPSTVRKEQMERLVDKLFPRLASDLRDRMRAEIESSWPVDPVERAKEMMQATAQASPQIAAGAGKAVKSDNGKPPVPGKKNRQGENNKK